MRGSVAVVKAEWVEDCLRSGTRLKETTYDTRGGAGGRHQDSERTGDGGGGGRGRCSNGDPAETEHDTDDEIEQVMRRQKRKRLSEEEEEGGEEDRDVMCDTDEEDGEQRREEIDARKVRGRVTVRSQYSVTRVPETGDDLSRSQDRVGGEI